MQLGIRGNDIKDTAVVRDEQDSLILRDVFSAEYGQTDSADLQEYAENPLDHGHGHTVTAPGVLLFNQLEVQKNRQCDNDIDQSDNKAENSTQHNDSFPYEL